MSDIVSHTELPWLYDSPDLCFEFKGENLSIADLDGSLVTMSYEEQDANGKFIVKACNNHYKLLKALKEAIDALRLDELGFGIRHTNIINNALLAIKEAHE